MGIILLKVYPWGLSLVSCDHGFRKKVAFIRIAQYISVLLKYRKYCSQSVLV